MAGKINGCLEIYRISIGTGYMVLFLLSWLLCYIYFTTAQHIFEFSRSQRLRTNEDITISKGFLILIISFFLIFCVAFLVASLLWAEGEEWRKLRIMDLVTGVLISFCSFVTFCGFVSSAVLLKISNIEKVYES